MLSRVLLVSTPWTVARKALLSIEFSRQEHWSGLPLPFPGDLPDPGIEPESPRLQVDSLPSEVPGKPVQWSTAAAAKSLSRVRLCASPWTAAHQAPPSMGFSRQEYWSGCHCLLQCRKVKSESEVAQLCPTLCDPMDCSPPGSSIHGIFQARGLEWVVIAFSDNGVLVSLKKRTTLCPLKQPGWTQRASC